MPGLFRAVAGLSSRTFALLGSCHYCPVNDSLASGN